MATRQGFTLIEVMIVVVIFAITATLALGMIGNTEASLRADRAAREAVAALRYARMMMMTTNGSYTDSTPTTWQGTYGVEFDTTNKLFQVIFLDTTLAHKFIVPQSMLGSGSYIVSLTRTELLGTTMTATITGDATNPYDLMYSGLGSTSNNGTVVFTYAGYKRTVTIPAVGDPTIQ